MNPKRDMYTSFFNPPNGNVFMKTKTLTNYKVNNYSFEVPIKSIVDGDYLITCKFYGNGFSGYIFIENMKQLINSKDLYGDNLFNY